MVLVIGDKEYDEASATLIVRAIEADTPDYPCSQGTLREFLLWSLSRLSDRIPLRDLDLNNQLSDEMLSFSYLCLLDEYRIGRLLVGRRHDSVAPERV